MMDTIMNLQVVCTVINCLILAFWIIVYFMNRRK